VAKAIPAITTEVVQAFADAWNRHDIDALHQTLNQRRLLVSRR